jgi:DNA-binding HxlR family transcriptional regulator
MDDDTDGPPASGGCTTALFGLLSQTHMMQILGVFLEAKGPVRFTQLQNQLSMSPNTLSLRLKSLVECGLLTRTAFSTIPPRVDYEVTMKAKDLRRTFAALGQWARKHNLEPIVA